MAALRILLLVALAAYSAQAFPNGLFGSVLGAVKNVQEKATDVVSDIKDSGLNNGLEFSLKFSDATSFAESSISNGIDKLLQLVEKLKAKVAKLESDVVNGLQKATLNVAGHINDIIKKETGVDLQLQQKWTSLENKWGDCAKSIKPEYQTVITKFKSDAEACAKTQIEEVKLIQQRVTTLSTLLETVPQTSFTNIKNCFASASSDSDKSSNALQFHLPDFSAVTCAATQVSEAAKKLAPVPQNVAELVQELSQLFNKESRKQIATCAAQAIPASEQGFQKAVADLAQCVIAPQESKPEVKLTISN